MYKILDNPATHGIAYNHDNNYYLISKDSVSEEEILTFSEATDEDGSKWLIIDARILSDYKVNDIQDYLALINTCLLALNQNHRILVCCGAGISRSNAVALGVLVKHFKMDFYDAWELIKEKVPISNIDPLHIVALKKKENREEACRIIETELRSNRNKITLTNLWKIETFRIVMRILDDENIQRHIFGSDKPLRRLRDILAQIDREELYIRDWMPIMKLFDEDEQPAEIKADGGNDNKKQKNYNPQKRRITIRDLMAEMFKITTENIDNRPLTYVDLSSSNNYASDTYWDEDIERTIVKRLFEAIYQTAVKSYQISKSLNCLIMVDEAHRFANKELHEDDESIVVLLRRYIRETRKFGVGWMFITTLADMDRAIVDQTGVRIFGYGLSMGPELARLKECVTDSSDIDFYLTFPHPLNALEEDQRIYSYMITGPISPLSNSYSPIFTSAFKTPKDYALANNLTQYDDDVKKRL